MSNIALTSLEQRVSQLEHSARLWRRGALSLGLLLAFFLLGAIVHRDEQQVSNEILARRFVLVDQDGRRRAGLGIADGAAILSLIDATGVPRAAFGAAANGAPSLTLFDDRARAAVTLRLTADRASGILLDDEAGRTRAALGLLPDGSPILALADADGSPLFAQPQRR